MNLVERAKAILLTPRSEWQVIETEPGDAQYLFTSYAGILMAIPAVASFIGMVVVGVGIGYALLAAVMSYVTSAITWYVAALVLDYLAPNFDGRKDFSSALKLATYSFTAAWLAGIFAIIPVLAILGIVGLYSLYLLWLGVPVLMKVPPERATLYTVAVIVVVIIISIVAGFILRLVIPAF
jgi:Yip1-like protein